MPLHGITDFTFYIDQRGIHCAIPQTCLFFPQDKLLHLHFVKYVEIALGY